MAYGDIYTTGLISTDPASPSNRKKFYGNGTLWGSGTTVLRPGDTIEAEGYRVTIASVEGDEECTSYLDWPGPPLTNNSYLVRQDSAARNTMTTIGADVSALIDALRIFDSAVPVYVVEEFGVNTPPSDYATGEALITGELPTGVFAGHVYELAIKTVNGWAFSTPEHGWIAIARDVTPNVARTWNADTSEWVTTGSLLGAPVWSGQWNADDTYAAGALVSYNNVIYAADRANTNSIPTSSPNDWTEFLRVSVDSGLSYTFKTSTLQSVADVAGQLNLSGDPSAAQLLRINAVDVHGNDWADTLASLAAGSSARLGRVKLVVPGEPNKQWMATVTAITEDGSSPGTRFDMVLSNPEAGSEPIADGDQVQFIWTDVGDIGATGTGTQGERGFLGGPVNVPYAFATEIADADPGAGLARLGSATQNASAVLRVDVTDANAVDRTALLDMLEAIGGTGDYIGIGALVDKAAPETKFLIFLITSVATPGGGGYRNFNIEMKAWSAANPFTAADNVAFSFAPLVQGGVGETGETGETGAAFTPDHVVQSIAQRADYDTAAVLTSVLVEDDTDNNGKPTLYFLQTPAGSPDDAVWSEGITFTPSAAAEDIEYDDAETLLGSEIGSGVTQTQQAIAAVAEIARFINAAEIDVAASSSANVFDTKGVNKRVTGTNTIITLGTGIGTRIIHWAAASPMTYNAVSLKTIGDVSRVNIVDSYSIWKSDGTTVREIYYSGSVGGEGAANSKNYVDNPSFDVWQRASSFALAAATRTQIADRWKAYRDVTGVTISRQTGFSGAEYCCRVQRVNGNASANHPRLWQQLLPPVPQQLQGKTVRLSFDVRAGANYSGGVLGVRIHTGTAGGQAVDLASILAGAFATGGVITTVSASVTPSTTAQRVVCNAVALGSTIKDLAFSIVWVPTGTAGADDYIEVTNVKLEIGSVATAFEPPDPAAEWGKCQYAYRKLFVGQIGYAAGTTTFEVSHNLSPPMRITPLLTLLDTSIVVKGTGISQSSVGSTISTSALTTNEVLNVRLTGFTGMTVNAIGMIDINDPWIALDADILS